MNTEYFNGLKAGFKGAPLDAENAIFPVVDMINAASFLLRTAGRHETGMILLEIAEEYASLVAENINRGDTEAHYE
ncbi:hypothetical protein EDF73_105203 [Raoultella sp. BIGb0138]|uniref:hypothetical protein n=1 Tax=Raoultella sp. BIGb0138 TaxID=2485115 RepID=UPI00104D2C89|nr:hypothetical protein [Raoultella sp. BIGb0138]TCW13564.1 hypothetical protein EDF73_105203 [Raoultella sp. BIGb0138]